MASKEIKTMVLAWSLLLTLALRIPSRIEAFALLQSPAGSSIPVSKDARLLPRRVMTSIGSTPTPDDNGKQEFWAQQKELALEMTSQNSKSLRQTQKEKFDARRLALVTDTAQFAVYIFCACWMLFDNPLTAFSYAFGATLGLAYSFGLGKSVETLGQSIDDVMEGKGGGGIGEARYAFLILLFVCVGKFRGEGGLQEIPSIAGFFTYQLASLSQGLREIND